MPIACPTTAGAWLAVRLAVDSVTAPLVLALTPTSLPFAGDIARQLGGTVCRILVEALDIPSTTGRCIGAVSETGHLALACSGTGNAASEEAIAGEMLNRIVGLIEQRQSLAPVDALPNSAGRNVILVADGLAGGATMVAAIRGIRSQQPLRLMAAIGVAPSRTLDRIRDEADETVALSTVASFGDVGRVRRAGRGATCVPSP
jgi:predicted phosphoribosyltransferase